MNLTVIRRVLGLLLLAASLVALLWGLWPFPKQTRSLEISPTEMLPEELPAGLSLDDLPAISMPRAIFLEWPLVMRTGDPDSIRLVFGFPNQNKPTLYVYSIPAGAYSTLAEALLELPAVYHEPPGQVSQALSPGLPVNFVWDLLPDRAADADGTVWLHLSFIPPAGGPELRQVLTAQRIEIRVSDFLGLSGPWARALGSAGGVVGVILGLDGVLFWLWRKLYKSGVA